MQKLSSDVIQVDRLNQVIGPVDLLVAHTGEGVLHRAISVFLFRVNLGRVEVLLQQRSQSKSVCPGLWANTVCGNVRWGESIEECALRRLDQELGINNLQMGNQKDLDKNQKKSGTAMINQVFPLNLFEYVTQCDNLVERELDQIYAGWFKGKIQPNPAEVSQTRWMAVEEVKNELQQNAQNFAPWFKLIWTDATTQQRINQFIS